MKFFEIDNFFPQFIIIVFTIKVLLTSVYSVRLVVKVFTMYVHKIQLTEKVFTVELTMCTQFKANLQSVHNVWLPGPFKAV